jgi:hypothetical protein
MEALKKVEEEEKEEDNKGIRKQRNDRRESWKGKQIRKD